MFLIQLCESGRKIIAHQHLEWGRWRRRAAVEPGSWGSQVSSQVETGAGLHSPAVVRPTVLNDRQDVGISEL